MNIDELLEDPSIDWSSCTWEGARKAQFFAFRALPLREKLEALQAQCDLERRLADQRETCPPGNEPDNP